MFLTFRNFLVLQTSYLKTKKLDKMKNIYLLLISLMFSGIFANNLFAEPVDAVEIIVSGTVKRKFTG